MSTWEWVRVAFLLGPIGVMLIAGVTLAVRSGLGRQSTPAGRLMENLSRTALGIGGSLVGFAFVHQLVGLRIPPIW